MQTEPTTIRLFDSRERTRTETWRPNEGTYSFLNSCTWPWVSRVRDYWEGWFAQYDGEKKLHLARRFQSKDGHRHLSAFHELFAFVCLKQAGYDLQLDPKVGQWELEAFASNASGLSFYVECTATGQSPTDAGADAREGAVLNTIADVDSGRFSVGIHFVERGPGNVQLGIFRGEYEKWIGTRPQERFVWIKDGWQIECWATPIDGEGGLGIIGPKIFDAGEQPRRLRDALDEKATKYGQLGRPLLVMANSMEHQSERELSMALLGTLDIRYNIEARKAFAVRKPNGAFGNETKPRNTIMSAVMHGYFGAVRFPPSSKIILVHHPYALHPLPHGLFPFCEEWYYDERGEDHILPPSTSLADFLGLPPGWPQPGEDPH